MLRCPRASRPCPGSQALEAPFLTCGLLLPRPSGQRLAAHEPVRRRACGWLLAAPARRQAFAALLTMHVRVPSAPHRRATSVASPRRQAWQAACLQLAAPRPAMQRGHDSPPPPPETACLFGSAQHTAAARGTLEAPARACEAAADGGACAGWHGARGKGGLRSKDTEDESQAARGCVAPPRGRRLAPSASDSSSSSGSWSSLAPRCRANVEKERKRRRLQLQQPLAATQLRAAGAPAIHLHASARHGGVTLARACLEDQARRGLVAARRPSRACPRPVILSAFLFLLNLLQRVLDCAATCLQICSRAHTFTHTGSADAGEPPAARCWHPLQA